MYDACLCIVFATLVAANGGPTSFNRLQNLVLCAGNKGRNLPEALTESEKGQDLGRGNYVHATKVCLLHGHFFEASEMDIKVVFAMGAQCRKQNPSLIPSTLQI